MECSEPLIYGNGYPEDGEYISGLFPFDEIAELKEMEAWDMSSTKMKSVIEKLHVEVMSKGKMVKKNLKYKLYNWLIYKPFIKSAHARKHELGTSSSLDDNSLSKFIKYKLNMISLIYSIR